MDIWILNNSADDTPAVFKTEREVVDYALMLLKEYTEYFNLNNSEYKVARDEIFNLAGHDYCYLGTSMGDKFKIDIYKKNI